MLEDSAVISAMGLTLAKLLRPLVRLLLKHSFPYSAFESIAKRVYVETAMEDFALPGRKPSVSRVSILTGLTRKDVNALMNEPWSAIDSDSTHYNRAARVVTAWTREKDFVAPDGTPRELAMNGANGFAELVRRHGGDVPARAVLDELVRVGSVKVSAEGSVQLVQRAFVPSDSILLLLSILRNDVPDLIETISYNIDREAGEPRYQRKVMHIGIPVEALPAFRALSSKKSQELLESFHAWLSEHDLGDLPEEQWAPGTSARVGVGIHYFEEVTGERKTKN
jgi:hypothetical protein